MVWLVKFAWIRACVKAGLLMTLITQISKYASQKQKNENCMLSALAVLEDSESMCL